MNVLSANRGHEVGKGVQTAFVRSPVEPVTPAGGQALHEVEVRTVFPGRRQCGTRPPGGGQPIVKILKVGVGDVDFEGFDLHIGTPGPRGGAISSCPDPGRRRPRHSTRRDTGDRANPGPFTRAADRAASSIRAMETIGTAYWINPERAAIVSAVAGQGQQRWVWRRVPGLSDRVLSERTDTQWRHYRSK